MQAKADDQAVRNSLRNSHCRATQRILRSARCRSLIARWCRTRWRIWCAARIEPAVPSEVRITLSHLREIGPNPGKGRHKLPQLDNRYLHTLRRLLPEQRIRRLLLLIR